MQAKALPQLGERLFLSEVGRETSLALMRLLPCLRVLGGCGGTDHRHVGEISRACGHVHAA